MGRKEFDVSELDIIDYRKCGAMAIFKPLFGGNVPPEPVYNTPITPKENWKLAAAGKKPYWIPRGGWGFCDINVFRPRIHPDSVVTHIICDGEEDYPYTSNTMTSGWFGLDWVFVPHVGGATVKPGNPKVLDASCWEKYVSLPDLDDMDFADCGEKNREFLNTPKMNQLGILSGFWERLMSLMDVEGAAVALIDEEQKAGVHRLFDALCNLYDEYIDRMVKHCDIDCVLVHDDWGTQNGPFFSLDTCMEMIAPYLKRMVESAHKRGLLFELHSCGKMEKLVPAILEADVDIWCPQSINDFDSLVETYKDETLIFGKQGIEVPQGLGDEEYRQLGRDWAAKYIDYHVCTATRGIAEAFTQGVYEYSRKAYQDAED